VIVVRLFGEHLTRGSPRPGKAVAVVDHGLRKNSRRGGERGCSHDEGVYYDLRSGKPDPALRPGDFTGYAVSGGFLPKGVTIGSRSGDARIFIGEMSDFFAEKLR